MTHAEFAAACARGEIKIESAYKELTRTVVLQVAIYITY